MPLRRTVRKLSSNLSIDTPILAAKAGLYSTLAAASARSMRLMVQVPPFGALGDERFARCPHQENVRLLRSRLKLIAAHLACRPTGADEMDLAKASAIENGLVPGCGAPAPAHKFT